MPDESHPPYRINFELIHNNVPVDLRAMNHWVAWSYVQRQNKWTKVPINPISGGNADSTDPTMWGTLEQAQLACRRGGLDGIGFVLAGQDDYCGIDLDQAIDSVTGKIKPWAMEILGGLRSYTEVSPSGCGLKILIRARKPGPRCKRSLDDGAVEIYESGRFFTITGQHQSDTPLTVETRQAELDDLYGRLFAMSKPSQCDGDPTAVCTTPNPHAPVDDETVIRVLEHSRNGERFRQLWRGQWREAGYSSQSEADLSLVSALVFMCGADVERIDRLVRRSGLDREKWNRADYQARTINRALQGRTSFYRSDTDDGDCGYVPHYPSADDGVQHVDPTSSSKESNVKVAMAQTMSVAPNEPLARTHPVERAKAGHPYPRTDLGNAERFAATYGTDTRYVTGIGWLVWDKKRWCEDDTGRVVRLAGRCIRNINREAATCSERAASAPDDATRAQWGEQAKELGKWARASESASRIKAMIDLAKAQHPIAIRIAELDHNPWQLNCLNGTIDLRSGFLAPHHRSDLITKLCPVEYDAEAQCPLWEGFLDRIFDQRKSLKEFTQRSLGYALTGVVHEHVVHILFGTGANGKSTLLETTAAMMGDYATAAAPRLLIQRKNDSHPTELADLRGARMVSSIETAEGGAFDEERVKALTGGDRIKGRKMRQDFFEFAPTHKLFLATNHRPVVKGDDNGIWRRLRLWPFTVEIPPDEQDPELKEKLLGELPGILAFCVRGCAAWQESGLCEPEEVLAATQAYREEQDHFGDWFAECCVTPEDGLDDGSFQAPARLLYQSYAKHAIQNGAKPVGHKRFKDRFCRRPGIKWERERTTTYRGVKLTDEALAAIERQDGHTQWGVSRDGS